MKDYKKTYFLIVCVFGIFFTSACKKENRCDCIKRTGKIIKETRVLNFFNYVEAEDNINVFITQDSVQEVIVEAGENIVPLIETELQGTKLFIRNKNRCNWTRSYNKPLNVYLRMQDIKYITNSGTAKIKGLNVITVTEFEIETKNSGDIELTVNNEHVISHIFGSGDVTLYGYTDVHGCSVGGTSYLYCANLSTSYTFLHAFSIGPCEINVSGLVDCKIDGKGDVFCYGNPSSVNQFGKGPGRLYLK